VPSPDSASSVDYNCRQQEPPSPSTFTLVYVIAYRPIQSSLTEILPTVHLSRYVMLNADLPTLWRLVHRWRQHEVASPCSLAQDSPGVRIGDDVATDNILWRRFSPSFQPPDGTATERPRPSPTSHPHLRCLSQSGICNVKTQLQSKFFADSSLERPPCRRCRHFGFLERLLMPSSAPTAAEAAHENAQRHRQLSLSR
jgi:hypothetical protein